MGDIVSSRNSSKEDVTVVLMLGGEGLRLRPFMDNVPKPMIEVGGTPLLETIVRNFVSQGFYNFYFCVNYKADVISSYFGDGSKFGAKISYLNEKQRMGTGGALGLIPEKPKAPLIIMNGDILTKADFSRLLKHHDDAGAWATMCIREHRYQFPYGVVNAKDGKFVSITEKPLQDYFINAGIYVLEPEVLDFVPENASMDMPQLFDVLNGEGKDLAVYPVKEYWMDIGHMEDLGKARADFDEVFG